jgi:antitoxin FitA
MGMLTIRNLPDDVYRALQVRAALHGRSTEAEVREILAMSVKSESNIKLGDALAELGRKFGITDEDIWVVEQSRDGTPAEPLIRLEIEPVETGDIDAVWRTEAESRLAQVEQRDTVLLPAEQVFGKLKQCLS